MKKVALIGSYPPPIGGVSVHLQRLQERLGNTEGFNCVVVDIKRMTVYHDKTRRSSGFYNILTHLLQCNIVHIHVSNRVKVLIAILSKLLRKNVIYTHHNALPGSKLTNRILGMVCDRIIVVTPSASFFFGTSVSTDCIPAYIPSVSLPPLRQDVKDCIDAKDLVIAANAYALNYLNGEEIYGVDILLDALKIVDNEISEKDTELSQKNVKAVFFDPSDSYRSHPKISNTSFRHVRFLRFTGNDLNFESLLTHSNVMIRPTRTDGDPLSVREAISHGVSVIASDAANRPPGTVLFSSGCARGLATELLNIIQNPESRSQCAPAQATNFFDHILKLYIEESN